MELLRRVGAISLLLMACVTGAQAGSDSVRYIGVEFGFNEGDFGTGLDSRLYSTTASAGVVAADYDASVSIPVQRLEDDAGFSTSGVGDVSAQVGYIFARHRLATLSGTAYLKLPTADRDEGLGTGEVDYGATVAVTTTRKGLRFRARTGLIKVGDPPGTDYHDVVLYGISVFGVSGGTGAFLSLEGRRATLDGVEDPLDLRIGAFRPVGVRHAVSGDLMVGLSDGSADVGVNIALVYWLD